MIFNVVIVLLLSVLQTTASEGVNSTSLGQNDEEYLTVVEGNMTNFVRKMKKEKKEGKGNRKQVQIDDGDDEAISNLVPNLRTVALADSQHWNNGYFAVSAAKSGTIKVLFPKETQAGDTVFLFLSRTDGLLPLRIGEGWNRGAECFKTRNRQPNCLRAAHCIKRDGEFCNRFQRGDVEGPGKDLATVLFYRQVTANDPGCITLDIPGGTTTWAIVTAITNVNQDDPIGRVAGTSCDVAWESVFPSVFGEKNDVLLLSQSFDDTAAKTDFRPPPGTDFLGFTNSKDEAGFLFGKQLDRTGQTGKLTTKGRGGPKCKDAMLSVVVNRNRN